MLVRRLPFFALIALFAAVIPLSPASADSTTTSYDDGEITSLASAASYLGISVAQLEITGVHVVRFINAISHNPPTDLSGQVDARSGRWQLSADWTAEDQATLDDVSAFYGISRAETAKAGAALLTFLAGVDSGRTGKPMTAFTVAAAALLFTDSRPPTTIPPAPMQCSAWPKDVGCYPQRTVPGTADFTFWSTHPCTVANAATNNGATGAVPPACLVTPLGKVPDPSTLTYPMPTVTSFAAFWSRWGTALLDVDVTLLSSIGLSPAPGGYSVGKDCTRVAQAYLILRSADFDGQGAGATGALLAALDPTQPGQLLDRCTTEIVVGTFADSTFFTSPARIWLDEASDGWARRYASVIDQCPSVWLARTPSFCGPTPIG